MKKINWDHARIFMDAARSHYEDGEYEESWRSLFFYYEETYQYPRSERQREVQRLWQQRGLLERTKANLRTIIRDGSIKPEHPTRILFGLSEVEELIRTNIEQMKTIKERIPK